MEVRERGVTPLQDGMALAKDEANISRLSYNSSICQKRMNLLCHRELRADFAVTQSSTPCARICRRRRLSRTSTDVDEPHSASGLTLKLFAEPVSP